MLSSNTTEFSSATLDDVLDAFTNHHPDGDTDLLRRAHAWAAKAHAGQRRKTGDPYITHPVAVAHMLAEYGLDEPTIAAALLHDTVEDTSLSLEEIGSEFGNEIARLIDGVTKLDRVRYSNREQAQAASIRKMVVAMAQDVRVLIVKLFDRLHNLRTVSALRPEKQVRVARETLDVYAPLAHRLGVQEIKHEFEDRCFAILYPGPNAEIEAKLAEAAPEREAFIEKMVTEIEGMLSDAGIEAKVTGRPKHQYSIYRKMLEQDRPFEEIHDLIGIRVITANTRDCYAALGLVHSHWVPVTGRFKDYVAMPKINLYQSLHTTVIGPDGKPLEIQIRTEEMHMRAESGIAAHWRYKEGDISSLPTMDIGSIDEDPEEFLANLKLDLYLDEVFVLTPDGDVKEMATGSTAVDFAYAVHTEVGHRCVGARVNGRLVPLSTKLSSGDIVEILTSNSPDAAPSRDWLKVVRTGKAKGKIRQWFQKERRDQDLAEGREQVMDLFKREAADLSASDREELVTAVAGELGQRDAESLYIAIGAGKVSFDSVSTRLTRRLSPDTGDELFRPPRRRRSVDGVQVVVEGQEDMLVHLANCCSPVPGDAIVGYVTVGRGVSVHRSDCTNVSSLSERRERAVEVSWPSGSGAAAFVVWIQVEALDRTRLLRDVTAVVSDTGGNITASSTTVGTDRVAVLKYEVELSDPSQLPRLLNDLRAVDGVFSAFRLANDPAAS
ncbi:MAG: bifunctional (p)ppGpp synthetase/guanosine-3',5'-bis(diphosphate) 3'-pyrophosphohydrolase [Actinobacteria bacterium]|nr:bifunctional (p)ppGpp synthetase/guanosine-3',5'-bis(diphosphate) 3'-pyrophosphohydrolase [Actinomycetota bacterium]